MPPIDTKQRREPFKAYACGRHCSLNVGGRCCRALLVDMDRRGARLHFDAMSLKTVAGCRTCRMDIDNMKDRRLARPLRCSVAHQEGPMVIVNFDTPLNLGVLEMQKMLGTAA